MIKYEITFIDHNEDDCSVYYWCNNIVEAVTMAEINENPLAIFKVIREGTYDE